MNSQGPLGVQGTEEKRNLPSGGELRGHLEGVFGHQRHSTRKIDPPGGLLAHPLRAGYAFLQYLALQGCPGSSPVWANLAQNGQKVLNKGYPLPCFGQFFSKIPDSQTMLSPIFEKKWGIFPRWTIRWGETPHFFPGFGERVVWVPGIFPGSCF